MSNVTFQASSSLMEDYRFATEITAGTQVAQVTNAAGASEFFYTGVASDQTPTIYHLQPDPASDTGWSVETIAAPATAQQLAGGVSADGMTLFLVFPTNTLVNPFNPKRFIEWNLMWTTRSAGENGPQWGPWNHFEKPPLSDQAYVVDITATVVDGTLWLAAVMLDGDEQSAWTWTTHRPALPGRDSVAGWVRVETVNTPTLEFCTTATWGPGLLTTRERVYGTTDPIYATDLMFSSLDGQTTTMLATGMWPSAFTYVSAALQAPGEQGVAFSGIFAFNYQNGPAIMFIDCSAAEPAAVQLDGTLFCKQIAAVPAGTNPITFCALDGQMRLNVMSKNDDGTWSRPMAIGPSFSSIAAGIAADGAPQLFGVDTANHRLTTMLQEPLSGDGRWVEQDIEVQRQDVEKVEVYGTTFTLSDGEGNRLPNATLFLTAPDTTTVAWRSGMLELGPGGLATVTTDGNGQVTLYAGTGTINTSKLVFSAPDLMPAGDAIVVDADDGVRKRLQNITVGETQSILPSQFQQDADQVQQGIASAMQYDAAPAPGLVVKNARYVAAAHRTDRYERPIDPSSATVPHWHFSVANGRATFRELTAEEASGRRRELQTEGFFGDFFESIGDIVESGVNAVATTLDVVFSAVNDAVEATIKCVIDGVTYFFDGVIETLERAMDVVTSIFAAVLVFFETLFRFLAWLFTSARTDIWNTKTFFESTFDQSFGFLRDTCSGQDFPPAGFFASLKTNVSAGFDAAIESVGGQQFNYSTGATGFGGEAMTLFTDAQVKVNWLLEKAFSFFDLTGLGISVPDSLVQTIQQLTTAATSAFVTAITDQINAFAAYLVTVAGSPDQFLSASMSAVLTQAKTAVLSILDLLDNLATQFMAAVRQLLQDVDGVLDQIVGGFFLEAIYNLMNPNFPFDTEHLTVKRFVAILCAFPVAILYSLVTGSSPVFDTDAAMTADMAGADATTIRKLGALLMICWTLVDASIDVKGFLVTTILGAFIPILIHSLLTPAPYPAPMRPGDSPLDKATNAFWGVGWLPIAWTTLFTFGAGFEYGPRKEGWSCGVLSGTGLAALAAGIAKGVEETKAGVNTFDSWFLNLTGPLVPAAKPLRFLGPGLPALVVIDGVGDFGGGVIIGG